MVYYSACAWNFYSFHLPSSRDIWRLSCLMAQALTSVGQNPQARTPLDKISLITFNKSINQCIQASMYIMCVYMCTCIHVCAYIHAYMHCGWCMIAWVDA